MTSFLLNKLLKFSRLSVNQITKSGRPIVATLVLLFMASMLLPQPASAIPRRSLGIKSGFTAIFNESAITGGNTTTTTLRALLINITIAILALLGVVAFLALVIGAFLYITSIGNEDRARRAKMAIIYAIAGLLIVGISAMLVNAIIDII